MLQRGNKKNPARKEWALFLKKEEKIIKRYGKAKKSLLEEKLKNVVPEGLQHTLETAFYKAFCVILHNGTGVLEKTYSKEKLETDHKLREYRHKLQATRRNLKAAPRAAAVGTAGSVAGAGIEGVALGLLGIGLPDIPLFLGMIFRSLYTLCLNYGIDYTEPAEQELLLAMIEQSLYRGEDFPEGDARLNQRIYACAVKGAETEGISLPCRIGDDSVRRAAKALSGELLYLKFLQGIPVAGIIGGVYDGIYLKRITDYAALKMERRYLLKKLEEG